MLHISQHVLDLITTHAKQGLPHEVCGYLAEKDGRIDTHYALTNIDATFDHFSMNPEEQFAAVKDMRLKGLTLKAVYHSHPETPARPSEEDIRLAYDPEISYVIISLAENEPAVKSFRIQKGEVTPEQITICEDQGNIMIKADALKDCRSVGCPMNMVHAKVGLSKLQSGQILELILDDGPPINNVPGSVQKEGHKILEKTQLDDGAWQLMVRKA